MNYHPPTPDKYPNLLSFFHGEEQVFGTETVIILATFDCDWEVWHFVQVHNHTSPGWYYHLLYAGPDTDHIATVYWDWEQSRPSWSEAAKKVEEYYAAPEVLRFILRPN